jgi:hypothetical protein
MVIRGWIVGPAQHLLVAIGKQLGVQLLADIGAIGLTILNMNIVGTVGVTH